MKTLLFKKDFIPKYSSEIYIIESKLHANSWWKVSRMGRDNLENKPAAAKKRKWTRI